MRQRQIRMVNDGCIIKNNVHIQNPGAEPDGILNPARLFLDFPQFGQKPERIQACFDLHHTIHEPVLICIIDRLGSIKPGLIQKPGMAIRSQGRNPLKAIILLLSQVRPHTHECRMRKHAQNPVDFILATASSIRSVPTVRAMRT